MEENIQKVQEMMDKSFEIGKIQGRLEIVSELIDLYDSGIEFLYALETIQAKNRTMTEAMNKSV